jgi:hypothetical protein
MNRDVDVGTAVSDCYELPPPSSLREYLVCLWTPTITGSEVESNPSLRVWLLVQRSLGHAATRDLCMLLNQLAPLSSVCGGVAGAGFERIAEA